MTYACIPQKDPNKQAPRSLFCQRCCLKRHSKTTVASTTGDFPPWMNWDTWPSWPPIPRRNDIKGWIPNFSNHRSHVFVHVPFRVEGWGMSRTLMVFYVCRHGIDRNASSLVPLQEPRKDDQFANKEKGKHWQTLMAAHTFRKGHCFEFPQHWLKKSGHYKRLHLFKRAYRTPEN